MRTHDARGPAHEIDFTSRFICLSYTQVHRNVRPERSISLRWIHLHPYRFEARRSEPAINTVVKNASPRVSRALNRSSIPTRLQGLSPSRRTAGRSSRTKHLSVGISPHGGAAISAKSRFARADGEVRP